MSIDQETYERWLRERDALRQQPGRHGYMYRDERELKMAEAKRKAAAAPVEDPAPAMEKIITCTPVVSQDPMIVLVVGAGGNGARIIPPLTQMLRRQDRLFIMDHDIVEDRNLLRQHFTTRDIGQPKALVLAQRYEKRDLRPVALVNQLTTAGAQATINGMEFTAQRNQLVIVGCVDNNQARKVMLQITNGTIGVGGGRVTSIAHIDVGNERRGGQVLMSLRNWKLVAQELGKPAIAAQPYSMFSMQEGMPQLSRATEWTCDACQAQQKPEATVCAACGRAPGTCGNRIDLQTVMVNHMAAGMVLNCLSWLMLGIPFTAAGAFFSTLNTVQPIKIARVDSSAQRLYVDTQYAVPA